MRWYDYAFCVMAADMISASIIHMDLFLALMGIIGYLIWENYRMEEASDNDHG